MLAGSVSQQVPSGGTVTTDPGGVGATPAVPVQTALTLPNSVASTAVSVPSTTTTDPSPPGFAFYGDQLTISTSGTTAPVADPFVVTFTIDQSLLGGGRAAGRPDLP